MPVFHSLDLVSCFLQLGKPLWKILTENDAECRYVLALKGLVTRNMSLPPSVNKLSVLNHHE